MTLLTSLTTKVCLFLLFTLKSLVYCTNIEYINSANISPNTLRYTPYGWLVSSYSYGTIYSLIEVEGYNNNYTTSPFFSHSTLISSTSFEIFDRYLYILNNNSSYTVPWWLGGNTSNFGSGFQASVIIYDITEQNIVTTLQLNAFTKSSSSIHFLNDIIIDSFGNAYISDSFYGAIFTIPWSDLKNFEITLLAESNNWLIKSGFGIDGISLDKQEQYLYVGTYTTGELFSVEINNPTNIQKLSVSNAKNLAALDMLSFDKKNNYLYVVTGGANGLYVFSIGKTGLLKLQTTYTSIYGYPTSFVIYKNIYIYLINSYIFENNIQNYQIEILNIENDLTSFNSNNNNNDTIIIVLTVIIMILLILVIICGAMLWKKNKQEYKSKDYLQMDQQT